MSNGTMVSLVLSAAMLLTPATVMADSSNGSSDFDENDHESKTIGLESPAFRSGSLGVDSSAFPSTSFEPGTGQSSYSMQRTGSGTGLASDSGSGSGMSAGSGTGLNSNLDSGNYTGLDPDGDGVFGPIVGVLDAGDSGLDGFTNDLGRSQDHQYGIIRDNYGEIVSVDLSNQNLTTNTKLRQKLNELGVVEKNLRSLDISGNGLSGTLDLSGFYNLWFVDCSDNALSSIVMKGTNDSFAAQPYGLDCSNNAILWLSPNLVSDPSEWKETREFALEDEEYWVNEISVFEHDFSNQSVSLSVKSGGETFDLHKEVPGMITENFSLAGASDDFVHMEFYSGSKAFSYTEMLVEGKEPISITGQLSVKRNRPRPVKPVGEDNQEQPLLPTDIVDPLDPAIPGQITVLQQNAGSANAYRLYNPNSGEHFYTEELKERDYLIKIGWRDEGVGWIAPKLSTVSVYRLYNKNAGDHHYTVSVNERDELKRLGWKDEGIGWYSDEGKSVPLFRQYNPNAKAGAHNYTPDEKENDYLVKVGWRAEGIAWYGLPGSERN